jgi:hypothetical protein
MMEDNFPIILFSILGLMVVFMIWCWSPYGRAVMKAQEEIEKQSALQEIELERERIKLAAEKARLEQELGVSLDPPEPEIVYVEQPVPSSSGMSEGTKTAIKVGAAGAAGYAIGRKWL